MKGISGTFSLVFHIREENNFRQINKMLTKKKSLIREQNNIKMMMKNVKMEINPNKRQIFTVFAMRRKFIYITMAILYRFSFLSLNSPHKKIQFFQDFSKKLNVCICMYFLWFYFLTNIFMATFSFF